MSIILNHHWVEIELNLDKAHQHKQNDHDKFIINVGQMIKNITLNKLRSQR
jgi:hypothetical protein